MKMVLLTFIFAVTQRIVFGIAAVVCRFRGHRWRRTEDFWPGLHQRDCLRCGKVEDLP